MKRILSIVLCAAAVAAFAAKHADDFAKIGDTDGFVIAEEGGFLGFGKKRLFTYDKERGEREWAPVGCDTSKARFDCNEANKRRFRECSNFAPTYGWINQGVRVTKKILAEGPPEEIAVPVCVFNAELDDTVLEPEQRSFIGRVPQGKFVQIEKATHTIFYCVDEVAHPYCDALLSWLR